MQTRIDEIADGVYRLSTHVAQVAPPAGFSFNQFLIDGEEPMLFHCGHRQMFPLIREALERVMPVDRLRWIGFGHVEADECGAMNLWLEAAPQAAVVHGALGCEVSLNDMAIRPPRALADDEVLDIGGRRLRWLQTPHVPHGWEAGAVYDETADILFCGDLLSHAGDGPPLGGADILPQAIAAEAMFQSMTLAPNTGEVLERLAALEPGLLAIMHGSSFEGDGGAMLRGLAESCEAAAAARR